RTRGRAAARLGSRGHRRRARRHRADDPPARDGLSTQETTFGGSAVPKAVVLTKYGPPDVLVWRDVAMPEPGPRQVRIRVKCAGVSPTDPKIRGGFVQAVFRLPPDAVLGFEAAGVVDALGSSVEGVTKGDEVACLLPDL